MGACMSSNADDLEQKKRSQAIDRRLEEDSRRLRRECKILLLGKPARLDWHCYTNGRANVTCRIWGEWKINHCKADEDYTPKWLQCWRACNVSFNDIQKRDWLRKSFDQRNETIGHTTRARCQPTILRLSRGILCRSWSRETSWAESRSSRERNMARPLRAKGLGKSDLILHHGFSTIVSIQLCGFRSLL